MPHDHWLRHGLGIGWAATAVALVLACSTKSKGPSCASPGGAVPGAQDTHCDSPAGPIVQVVDPAACTGPLPGDAGTGDDGGTAGDDGGAVPDAGDIGNCGDRGYGATMFGQSGADDDCKYDVTWTSTPICEGQPVYFTVTATRRTDHSPVTGANPSPDVVLDCTHPIPNDPKPVDPSPETSPGIYTVGPLEFDRPGRWVFRFHFFETCEDDAASPHGHAAFYVDVP